MEYNIAFHGMYVKIFIMDNRNILLGANIAALSVCYQHLSARINRALEPLKLNMTQLSILNHFAHMPENAYETVSRLSQIMEMNQPMITKAIKAMVDHGLIIKKASPEDARVAHLHLSDAGRGKLDEARQHCYPIIAQAYESLGTEELVQMLNQLDRIKNSL